MSDFTDLLAFLRKARDNPKRTSISCPRCSAAAGRPCQQRGMEIRATHPERIREAELYAIANALLAEHNAQPEVTRTPESQWFSPVNEVEFTRCLKPARRCEETIVIDDDSDPVRCVLDERDPIHAPRRTGHVGVIMDGEVAVTWHDGPEPDEPALPPYVPPPPRIPWSPEPPTLPPGRLMIWPPDPEPAPARFTMPTVTSDDLADWGTIAKRVSTSFTIDDVDPKMIGALFGTTPTTKDEDDA